jgi:TolB-like protein
MNLQFDEGEIKHQVSRILDAQSFKSSNILSKFLYYIVSETLEGNEGSLKEYVIATNVLNKKADFDPQLDAIVRIHARRLRNLLEQYYIDEGLHDPIRISIPKGRYIPIFENNNTKKPVKFNGKRHIEHKIANKPVVAVIPSDYHLNNERSMIICSVLCRDLCVALTRYDEISVVSHYVAQVALDELKDVNLVTNQMGIDYLINISCLNEENRVRVTIELNSIIKNQLIWAESFYIDDFKKDKIGNYNSIIRWVLANIGGFFGMVYRDSLDMRLPDDYNHMYAIYWHNRYHKHFSEEAFHESLKAVNIGLEKNPENSLLTSFKAQLYLDLKSMDVQGETDYFKEGLDLALRAIDLDQKNQHAWMMYAWAGLLAKDKKEFTRAAEKCIEINPNNTMYTGSCGFGYECAGEYERGLELMSEAIKLDPYYFWNMNIGFCFYYLSHKEYDEAFLWAEKINRRALLWDPLLRASTLGHLGRNQEASGVVEELMTLSPNFTERARIIIDAFLLDKDLQNTIIQGLVKAGIKIAK